MTENWRLKLEESSFDDLSQEDRTKLIKDMEADVDLRKKVVSDLRFESVLKETLRTEENASYREELAQTWSVDRVRSEMIKNGMTPQKVSAESPSWVKNRSWVFIAFGLGCVIVVMIFLFFKPSSGPPSQTPKVLATVTPTGATFIGESIKLTRDGKEMAGKVSELLDGDILSTTNSGWGELSLGDGLFVELGRNAKAEWQFKSNHKELLLLKGSLTATFAKSKSENLAVLLGSPLLSIKGRGYKVDLIHNQKSSRIELIEGRVEAELKSNQGSQVIRTGEIYHFSKIGEVKQISKNKDLLEKELVGWWSMDDGQGKTIDDFSGSGFKGSLADHVKLAEGHRGQALKISEINRKNLVIPHSQDLNIHPVNGITVMAWIKTTRINTATILDKRYGERKGGKYHGYQMVLTDGKLSFQMDDGRTLMFQSRHFVADGQWHHICVSVTRGDKEKGIFYVDGDKVGQFDSKKIGNTDSLGALNIGGHVDLDNHAFVGYIDEVRVYRRGLSQKEIESVMNRTD